MARPKGKLFALLAIFMAIGIVTATGAFTSVQADRTVSAEVQGDQSALVGLVPHTSGNGYGSAGGGTVTSSDGYAQISDGTLDINLGGYSGGVAQNQGLNYNATTDFDFVFNITNNGAQNFDYYISRNNEAAGANNAVVFYQGQAGTGNNVTGVVGNARTLTPGQTEQISIQVDLQGVDSNTGPAAGTSLLDSITIHADAP